MLTARHGFRCRPSGHDREPIYEFLPTIKKEGTHGKEFHYRTPNTDVVGWLIARATGKSLAERSAASASGASSAPRRTRSYRSTRRHAARRQLAECAAARPRAVRRDDAARRPFQRPADRAASGRRRDPARRRAATRSCSATTRLCRAGATTDQWWVSHDDHGVYMARGIHGQAIYVDPAAEMVIARFASHPLAGNVNLDPLSLPAYRAIAERLMAK